MTERDDLEAQRRSLIGLAYRMLGSVADAEDIVQDALIRWHRHPNRSEIASPRAFLAQVTVRLCIDRLKSARTKREVYVGPWLPEPVVDGETLHGDASTASELASDLSVALLLALERLSPLERAAFILHDVFDTDWSEIAAALERSEAACRQLASRARAHVRDERPRFRPSIEERDRILQAFGTAVATGDVTTLKSLLSADAVFLGDGGGEVKSALKPVVGNDRVARLVIGLQAKAVAEGEAHSYTPAWLNGLPGFLLRGTVRAIQTATFEVDEAGRIRAIYVVSNPSKLRHLRRVD
jgi:RNA polymerase sigma-70 factor, ECF subfamily